ncbi:Glycosyltransferase involved in cell wall bisynthesis [Cognatiyoonia koreensis]|uniref:Glycosyltransferase involved in cell wall bisynthesis n=1 Tax=Cognatiyoonia koreensis TaxID=364200 RepID=A0A1I0RK62_9RHOB|nr:glycosyltransferase family 4 protein [Cognatiyoonia koreensis]SEW41461.1 Glycosyltransferase involved in cell wall bisynthesis [Cognatiyoonia koreensis]
MTPAIYFHPDAVEGKGADLVGRRSAGQSFVRAFQRYGTGDQINVVTETAAHADDFRALAEDFGETRPVNAAVLRDRHDFTKFGTVFFPSPGYLNAVWQRARGDMRRCSLVGITHTVSTRRIVENLHNLMLQPVEPWDAIICTSRAVQSVVARQFALEADYIRARFGAQVIPQPQLPIIPLGIHAADFAPTDDGRAQMRGRFETPDDAVVVMTMGRLTSVEKANPVPLFMALERIAKGGQQVHLWMVGWSDREGERVLHETGANALCPSVTVHFIDGREPDVRRHIWSGADIFTLPVDNIQETFGLVPVEAMAAGLPVVMPDWNGFRDTVVDGLTGMLVPTIMAPPDDATGRLLASRFADGSDGYLYYLSCVQQQTVLDVQAYTKALDRLVQNKDLRKKMGAAGRAHVTRNFDWSAVIPQYMALADELARQRQSAKQIPRVQNPMEASPFDTYRHYPSRPLTADTVIVTAEPLDAEKLADLDMINGRKLYKRKVAPDSEVFETLALIAAHQPLTMGDLLGRLPALAPRLNGIVLFLAKYDFVTLGPQVSK